MHRSKYIYLLYFIYLFLKEINTLIQQKMH